MRMRAWAFSVLLVFILLVSFTHLASSDYVVLPQAQEECDAQKFDCKAAANKVAQNCVKSIKEEIGGCVNRVVVEQFLCEAWGESDKYLEYTERNKTECTEPQESEKAKCEAGYTRCLAENDISELGPMPTECGPDYRDWVDRKEKRAETGIGEPLTNEELACLFTAAYDDIAKAYEFCCPPGKTWNGAIPGENGERDQNNGAVENPPQPPVASSGLFNADCSINEKVFDADWRKYSDIDEAIPIAERSWEAQQVNNTLATIALTKLDMVLLQRGMGIDRELRKELRDYRKALIKNIKVNLLKSFWRLTYITTDIIVGTPGLGEGAVGTGKTFSKLITSAEPIEQIGAALKVLRDMTPSDSKYSINTKEITGKVEAVSLTAALEALDSMGNPMEIGKGVAQDIAKQALPSADLTEEEIGILRTQHLKKRIIDDVLQESYRLNSHKRKKLKQLESKLEIFENDLGYWEKEEKDRTAKKLVSSCKKQKGLV